MTPDELSEMRDEQDAAEREAEIVAAADLAATMLADKLEQMGRPRPSPYEFQEAARSFADAYRRQDEEAESAVRDAASIPYKPAPIGSASQFIESRVSREAAIVRVASAFGEEIEASERDLRRMAVTFLDQVTQLSALDNSANEHAVHLIEEMKGEFGGVDPDTYVANVRAEMGLPPESESSSN